MVIVGGVGNFRGPLVGALLLLLIPEGLRFLAIPDAIAANIRLMLYGILLVVMMHFRPQGHRRKLPDGLILNGIATPIKIRTSLNDKIS
jgi:ABC-type branched-subunit amino acid transport system permease subunit